MAVKRKKKREATQEDWDRDASIQKDRVMGYGMHPVLSTTLLTIWAFSVLVLFVLGYQACEFFGISGPDASPVAIVLVLIIIPLTLWILEMVLIGKFIKRKDQNRINDLVVNGKCRRVVVQGSSAWHTGGTLGIV